MKVLTNGCYGGFGISNQACILWLEKQGIPVEIIEHDDYFAHTFLVNGEKRVLRYSIDRADPVLIEIFEEKGTEFTSGSCSELELNEIPDGCEYSIHEYDGSEYIDETWINVTLEELKNGLSEDKLRLAQQVSCIRILDENPTEDTMQ
jgi:hypothetical protein